MVCHPNAGNCHGNFNGRGGEVDGSTAEFAVAGMQLQEPTAAAAAEGSGGESMVPGDAGPPTLSTLDDVAPRPAVVDPSSAGPPAGGVAPAVGLTLEQAGAATQDAFRKAARLREAEALQDAGDARRMSGQVLTATAAPGEGAVVRTGLGVGHGVFDAVYVPPAEEAPLVRFGRGYSDKERWSEKEAQDFQTEFQAGMSGAP